MIAVVDTTVKPSACDPRGRSDSCSHRSYGICRGYCSRSNRCGRRTRSLQPLHIAIVAVGTASAVVAVVVVVAAVVAVIIALIVIVMGVVVVGVVLGHHNYRDCCSCMSCCRCRNCCATCECKRYGAKSTERVRVDKGRRVW